MKAAGVDCKKINGGGDIYHPPYKSEVKFLVETLVETSLGLNREWRFNGVRPDQDDWHNLYVVVQQGDHASNEVLVIEFTREATLRMIEAGDITFYGQQQKGDDGTKTNVIEFRAHDNSRRSEIKDHLLPYANNIVRIPQHTITINYT